MPTTGGSYGTTTWQLSCWDCHASAAFLRSSLCEGLAARRLRRRRLVCLLLTAAAAAGDEGVAAAGFGAVGVGTLAGRAGEEPRPGLSGDDVKGA